VPVRVENAQIRGKVREFLHDEFPRVREGVLTDEDALLGSNALDSLGLLKLITFLETEYAITVTDEELLPQNFQTIGRLADFVASKLNGQSNTEHGLAKG
jgi:acyl carrier protein